MPKPLTETPAGEVTYQLSFGMSNREAIGFKRMRRFSMYGCTSMSNQTGRRCPITIWIAPV